jgi:hypothetical protein
MVFNPLDGRVPPRLSEDLRAVPGAGGVSVL